MRYNPRLSRTSQLSPLAALGIWATLTLAGALYFSWHGYGGRAFAATLTSFAFFFLLQVLLAARGLTESLTSRLGGSSGYLLGVAAFLVYLIYSFGTNTFAFGRVAAIAGMILIPLVLAAGAQNSPPGAWQDFLTLGGVWVVVKFVPAGWLWPLPGGGFAHVMVILFNLTVALAAFVLIRKLDGVGYWIGWQRNWAFFVLASFALCACIVVPLGTGIHFIQFAPRWSEFRTIPLVSLGILAFTAWPEEFLFRGLLQNMLARACSSDLAGWWTASILFGLSHLPNGGFPNWKYALLASIAGLFYGWTWRKSGSIFASALVHTSVNVLWHFLFKTL
jgi:membrane protease YdiL (CAAX protease family)